MTAVPNDLAESALIFFSGDHIGLDEAATVLEALTRVTRDNDTLVVRWPDQPALYVTVRCGDDVRALAKSVGAGSTYEERLDCCDACFAIAFEEMEATLEEDEIDTFIETVGALQALSGGVGHFPWSGGFVPPRGA